MQEQQKEQIKRRKVVVAFDFETAGGVPVKNGFLCLGACICAFPEFIVLNKFRLWTNMQGYEWDEECVKRFWAKKPELYKEAQESVAASKLTPFQVVDLFIRWIDMKCIGYDGILISDNVGFDGAILRTFSMNRDIGYMFRNINGDPIYRDIVDVSSFYYGMNHCVGSNETFDDLSSRDQAILSLGFDLPEKVFEFSHDALDDAINIAKFWCFIHQQIILKALKNKMEEDLLAPPPLLTNN